MSAATDGSEAETLVEDANLRASAVGRAIVMAFLAAPRGATVELLRQKVAPIHERYADGVVLVVSSRGGPPDDDARQAFREMVRAVERTIAGVVVLLPIRGLRGTVVRAAVQAAVRAFGFPFEVRLVETPEAVAGEALRMLRARGVVPPPQRALEAALASAAGPTE